jgi:prepilin-type N-terminal cleavage/methylation domain-containing protein/prepilin-type processing-associated H-X9-DG protein
MRVFGRQVAFTLIELLIVIAIIAMLVGTLLPSLVRSKELARQVTCLNNVRNMVVAAQQYATMYGGSYPLAKYQPLATSDFSYVAWDFRYRKDGKIEAGLLWQIGQDMRVQQCPSYEGPANWPGDKYTGYNYNTSYIGHGQWESIFAPAKVSEVNDPSRCALFGDGEYAGGANKFMRAPFKNPGDATFSRAGRCAGTQGYRHLETTSVGFCDGHADAWAQRHTEMYGPGQKFAPGTGFLSPDNSLYDLE